MDEHYTNAKNTAWASWKDSDMRDWLVNHGHIKANVKAQRDDVSKEGRDLVLFSLY
jgi:hypothetical protein